MLTDTMDVGWETIHSLSPLTLDKLELYWVIDVVMSQKLIVWRHMATATSKY